jgi:hypothetical protein
MKYNLSGETFDFVFNGHRLVPGPSYTLIYYPDPWPGNGLICFATGIANAEGDLNLRASFSTGTDLPKTGDTNTSAKIWLVPSSYVDCTIFKMLGFNRPEFLLEMDLITFDLLP